MTFGVQCVTLGGMTMMLVLFVDKQDTLLMVNKNNLANNFYY